MNVLTITHRGVTRTVSDLDLVDQLLERDGVSLYRRLAVRQSGQVREWLQAGHTAEEMLTLARAGEAVERRRLARQRTA